MVKLYKRVKGKLHYHEAWCADGGVVEHWGVVGKSGKVKEHVLAKRANKAGAIKQILQSAVAQGFAPIPLEKHAMLVIEYRVADFGSSKDGEKRHALQERMDEALGWTGIGHCDGSSTGAGAMEVSCYVVDFDLAKQFIEADLSGSDFGDYARIYCEDTAT